MKMRDLSRGCGGIRAGRTVLLNHSQQHEEKSQRFHFKSDISLGIHSVVVILSPLPAVLP